MARGRILLIILSALALPFLLYYGIRIFETRGSQMYEPQDYTQIYEQGPDIHIGGQVYRRRSGLTTVLLMGIDREKAAGDGALLGGQADFLRLLVIDHKNSTVSQLEIDRDTMVDINVISVTGQLSGTRRGQISLAHGFGDNEIQRSELTVEAVERLLSGLDIDFYMAMNMDGIPALNDWAGGVTVTLEEDFSMYDPAMTQGTTVTLMGRQAEYYVRSRTQVGDGTNLERMVRQQEYITQLISRTQARISKDENEVQGLLKVLDEYILTDMPHGRFVNEFWAAREYERPALFRIDGVHGIGANGYVEFEADAASLRELTISLFCESVDKK